jgi:hypothetical protein
MNTVLHSPKAAERRLAELGVPRSVPTLARYRCRGGGPEFILIGRNIKYPDDALVRYARRITSPLMAQNHVPVTTEPAGAQP